MTRMAIQHQSVRIACVGWLYVRRDLASASFGRRFAIIGSRAALLARALRKLSTLLLALAFLAGAVFYGPAAHRLIEADAPAVALARDVAMPGAPTAPAKGHVVGFCTGHCAAHVLTLPALSPQPIVPMMIQSTWTVVDDQVSQAARPALLERPPRV